MGPLSCLSVCLSVTVYCGQTVEWIKMKLGMEVVINFGHIVLNGNPAPPAAQPPFSAHVGCGQRAGWIKMPLCTEVGFGPGDIVLHGIPTPPPPKKGQSSPTFRPMYCGQAAGCIKVPLGVKIGLGPDHIVLDGDPTPPLGHSSPQFFGPS